MAQSMNRIAWQYTDDNGDTYVIRAVKAVTDQLNGSSAPKVGGIQSVAGDLPWPQNFKPRKAVGYSAAGLRREFICYDTTCDAWVTMGTTLQAEVNDTLTTFTIRKRKSEVLGRQFAQSS